MTTSRGVSPGIVPYWRLSGLYFFLFAFIGIFAPYWPPFLKDKGLTAEQIGIVFATLCGMRMLVPHVWAYFGDKIGRHLLLAKIALLGAAIAFYLHSQADVFSMIVLSAVLYAIFWDGLLPQFEAVTLHTLGAGRHGYMRIRVWGSIAFIVTSYGAGLWLETYTFATLPVIMLICIGLLAINTWTLPDVAIHHSEAPSVSILSILSRPTVWLFFLACFFLQASHGAYYGFYSLYLGQHGYDKSTVGMLWAVGVVAEVIMFWFFPKLKSLNAMTWLWLLAFVLTAIRWFTLTYYIDDFQLVFAVQLIHAASFGVFHAIAILFIQHWFKGVYLARGQALYSAIGFGAGAAFGMYISGVIWDRVNPAAAFNAAMWLAITAIVIATAMLFLRDVRKDLLDAPN